MWARSWCGRVSEVLSEEAMAVPSKMKWGHWRSRKHNVCKGPVVGKNMARTERGALWLEYREWKEERTE